MLNKVYLIFIYILCTIFGLSHSEFKMNIEETKTELKNMNYSIVEIEKIIQSQDQIHMIVKYHNQLISCKFNPKQIFTLTLLSETVIERVIDEVDTLLELLKSHDRITLVATKVSAKKTIDTLLENENILKSKGFEPFLYELVHHKSGHLSLHAALQYDGKAVFHKLCSNSKIAKQCNDLGITQDNFVLTTAELVSLLKFESGDLGLKAFEKNYIPLRQLGFSKEQILNISSTNMAPKAINSMAEMATKFIKHGFLHQELVVIYSDTNADKFIQYILTEIEKGTPKEQLIKNKYLYTRAQNQDLFNNTTNTDLAHLTKTWNLTETQIESIVTLGGQLTIDYLKENYSELVKLLEQDINALYTLSNHKGGSCSLKGILQYYAILNSHFTKEQIVSIAKRCGGIKNLEMVVRHLDVLCDPEFIFTKQQVIDIVSYQGGGLKIDDLVTYLPKLKENHSAEAIYKYYNHSGHRRAVLFLELDEEANRQYLLSRLAPSSLCNPERMMALSLPLLPELGMFNKTPKRKLAPKTENVMNNNQTNHSQRSRKKPRYLDDYYDNDEQTISQLSPVGTETTTLNESLDPTDFYFFDFFSYADHEDDELLFSENCSPLSPGSF